MFDHQRVKQPRPYGELSTSLVMQEEISSPQLSKRNKMKINTDVNIPKIYDNQSMISKKQNSPKNRQYSPPFNEPASPTISINKKQKKAQLNQGLANQQYNNQQTLLPLLKNSQHILYNKHIAPQVRNIQQHYQDVQQNRNNREHRVYDLQSDNPPNMILNNMYNQLNRNNKQLNKQIEQVMGGINAKHQNNRKNQQDKNSQNSNNNHTLNLKVPRNKTNLKQLQQIDRYRFLKIRNGEIKNKVGNLREQMEEQYYQNKAMMKNKLPQHDNIKQSDYYSLDNPKTHEAKVFISQLQKKRQQQHTILQQRLQYQKQMREQQKYQQQIEKMQQIQQRKHMRQIQYAEQQMKRKLQQSQNSKKKEDIKNWASHLNQEGTPLYIKKQQQFIQNSVIPQIYQRHRVLQNIHKQRQLNFQDIDQHDQWYMAHKGDQNIKKQIMMDLKRNQLDQAQQQQSKYYKGLYRYNALSDMYKDKVMSSIEQEERRKQIDRVKRARQLLYSDGIREQQKDKQRNFKTMEEPKKQFKRRTRNIDGSITEKSTSKDARMNLSERSDPKTEGKRNLHYLKQLVQQKGIKRDKPMIRLVQQRGVYPDYMEQRRQEKRRSHESSRVQGDSRYEAQKYYRGNEQQKEDEQSGGRSRIKMQTNSNDINKLKAISMSLDERMKRNHLKMKNNGQNIEFDDDCRMEQEDIEAVRAKIKLISKVD